MNIGCGHRPSPMQALGSHWSPSLLSSGLPGPQKSPKNHKKSSCLVSERHICVLWATVTLANTSLQLADAAAVSFGSFSMANRLVSSGAVAGQPAGSPPVRSTETLLCEELLWRMSDRKERAEDQKWVRRKWCVYLQNYSLWGTENRHYQIYNINQSRASLVRRSLGSITVNQSVCQSASVCKVRKITLPFFLWLKTSQSQLPYCQPLKTVYIRIFLWHDHFKAEKVPELNCRFRFSKKLDVNF